MVKIEVDEEKKRNEKLQSEIDKISEIVSTKYRLECRNINEEAYYADIIEPFIYTKRKYLFWKETVESDGGFIQGHLVFVLDTNKINLHGSKENLRDIAERLEQNGYDVTIFDW